MKTYFFLLFSFLFQVSFAQLVIDDSYTPDEMIMDFFGSNAVSNISYQGENGGIAFFQNDSINFPINAGIILSTGNCYSAVGPNTVSDTTTTNNGVSDDDINAIAGGNTNDVALIEFDFIPTADSISFSFVFASEEYCEYVGAYNDAFGFFLSGPGINGPYSNGAINIALIPGTLTPVSINTLNSLFNAQYYIDNYPISFGQGGGCTFEEANNPATNPEHIQYDGYTTLISIAQEVMVGESYHIKIGVGDFGDAALDSAVFLSFGSMGNQDSLVAPTEFELISNGNSIEIQNESKYALEYEWDFGNGEKSMERNPPMVNYEEPGTYDIKLKTYTYCCTDSLMASIEILDSLIANIEPIKHVSCFGGHDGELSINITGGIEPYELNWIPAFGDSSQLEAGQYSYILYDADSTMITGSVEILEPSEINTIITTTNTDFGAQNGTANVAIVGGTPDYDILWSNGLATDSISNLPSGVAWVQITDANGCIKTDTFEIMENPAPLILDVDVLQNALCYGQNTGIADIQISGGIPPYTISWDPLVDDPSQLYAGDYTIQITDAQDITTTASIQITEPDELVVQINASNSVSGMNNGIAEAVTTGGTPEYSYLWNTGSTEQIITDLAPAEYDVMVLDSNGCQANQTVIISDIVSTNDFDKSIIQIYPNPANDILTIELEQVSSIKSINFYQLNGQEVSVDWLPKTNKVDVQVHNLKPNHYIIKIEFSDGIAHQFKFIKS